MEKKEDTRTDKKGGGRNDKGAISKQNKGER
jgi:hypothetical protein